MNDEKLLNVTSVSSEFFDQERLELMRSASYSRISSRNGSVRITAESLTEKYNELPKEDLVELMVTTELRSMSLEDENYALVEQVNLCQTDLVALQSQFARLKSSHAERVADLVSSRDTFKALSEKRESEIIFLEDHARFSAEQTKLSISHWELLLRNRDENIELLTSRVTQLTNDSRMSNESGVTNDKYKCALERIQALEEKYRALKLKTSTALSEGEESAPTGEKITCPWRHQADVRVAQLERVTAQLNATYEQLHTKSDELLVQNRELGSMRSKIFECEARIKRNKAKIAKLRSMTRDPSPTQSSSLASSE